MGRMGHLFLKLFRVHACVCTQGSYKKCRPICPIRPIGGTKMYCCGVVEKWGKWTKIIKLLCVHTHTCTRESLRK